MSKREVEMYQAGLVDAVQNRPTLTEVLAISGQTDLLLSYVEGLFAGRKLLEGK